ncbi:hypothetical protein, partial [Enterobacter asburiae]|uniref:hypothetical protein n=1 Tax=Enterobacter asburiae TaxID=61645 RepID=UPI0021C844B3
GKNSLNRLIRCVCGKKIGPDPRNFNQRVSLGRNDLLIRTFLRHSICSIHNHDKYSDIDKVNYKILIFKVFKEHFGASILGGNS